MNTPAAQHDKWKIDSMTILAESLEKRGDDLSTDSATWLREYTSLLSQGGGQPVAYFSGFDGSVDRFDTLEAARDHAQQSLEECRGLAPEGWPEETESICYGIVLGRIVQTECRPATKDDVCWPDCAEYVDYELSEVASPPNSGTDAARERELKAIIERDRTMFADTVTAMRRKLAGVAWMKDSRGCYEWDDERYQREFGEAISGIQDELDKIAKRAGDAAVDVHPKTRDLVERFSRALLEKLAAAEKKYGYSDGWADNHWMEECRAKLIEHVAKGDPRDVAAYCAFLWHHGESTKPSGDATAGEAVAKVGLHIDDPRKWRISTSGFTIVSGYNGMDRVEIAAYPGIRLPGKIDNKRFKAWMEYAERICDLHNVAIEPPSAAPDGEKVSVSRDLIRCAAIMLEDAGTPVNGFLMEGLRAALESPAMPDGDRVIVSREATQEMIEEAYRAWDSCPSISKLDGFRAVWKAMLKTAPTPRDASSARGESGVALIAAAQGGEKP